ncbi:hypothetical protein [Jannaschia rubra]|uniref:Isochorismatase family protein n=1 Tax=Jannaschia rubra TaxID=282197 RepID=A0A0M6XUZ0_9RHOB|nr:hypothetical protein [Jannaschia rubra]CTQ34427.1 hypothetical protein JAN5088_03223 [Jannaschia rubra]SFG61615.1 hypothetical protein SAMN04488517_1087 [Jannaschia rubra]
MKIMTRLGRTVLALATGAAMLAQPFAFTAAQAQEATEQNPAFAGLTRPPSESDAQVLFDSSDAVLLMLDHQTGLFQTVNDVPIADLRNNATVLTKIAQQADMPIIYTASEPKAPTAP